MPLTIPQLDLSDTDFTIFELAEPDPAFWAETGPFVQLETGPGWSSILADCLPPLTLITSQGENK